MFKYLLLVSALILSMQNCYAELVDPTRPANYQATYLQYPNSKTLMLSAIIIRNQQRFAIINGQNVQIGDTIAEFKILDIKPYVVRLLGASGAFDLPLVQQTTKNSARQGLVK